MEAIRESDGRLDSQQKAKAGADLVEPLASSRCRLAEATPLQWRGIGFGKGVTSVPGGDGGLKNNEHRQVPMTSALQGLLERLSTDSQHRPDEFVSKIDSARRCITTACLRLDLPQFTHHDFRHCFATTCIEAGVDIPTVSRWLGSKDGGALAMRVYGHLRQEHSFAAIKRVSFGCKFDEPRPLWPIYRPPDSVLASLQRSSWLARASPLGIGNTLNPTPGTLCGRSARILAAAVIPATANSLERLSS